jgi:hypothetical protein
MNFTSWIQSNIWNIAKFQIIRFWINQVLLYIEIELSLTIMFIPLKIDQEHVSIHVIIFRLYRSLSEANLFLFT